MAKKIVLPLIRISFFWVIVFVLLMASVGCGPQQPSSAPTMAPTMPLPTIAIEVSPTASPDVERLFPAASQLCENSFSSEVREDVMETPILTIFEDKVSVDAKGTPTEKHWQFLPLKSLEGITSMIPNDVRTLVCVKETLEQVGCYTQSGGVTSSPTGCIMAPGAFKRHWDIRLIRLQDKEVIRSIELEGGDPPNSIALKENPFGGYIPETEGTNVGSEPLEDLAQWMLAPPPPSEFQANFKNVTRLNSITADGQTVIARDGQIFVLVEFEVSGCDNPTPFFFPVKQGGQTVDESWSGFIVSSVFCNNVEALTISDANGKGYLPVGFVSYSTVVFQVEEIAEGLTLQINDATSIPLP